MGGRSSAPKSSFGSVFKDVKGRLDRDELRMVSFETAPLQGMGYCRDGGSSDLGEIWLQDNVRNQLIQFELLLTTGTFVVAIFGVVAGVFGMNFAIPLFDDPIAFQWVLIVTGICGIIIFCGFLWYFKYRRLMPL